MDLSAFAVVINYTKRRYIKCYEARLNSGHTPVYKHVSILRVGSVGRVQLLPANYGPIPRTLCTSPFRSGGAREVGAERGIWSMRADSRISESMSCTEVCG